MQVRRQKFAIDGWIALDKPLEMTSTQAVGAVKRILSPAKIGHAGTLDPLATGILPLALGEATKTVPFVMDATKEYRFTLAFGHETTTDDREGAVTATSAVRPDDAAIRAALPAFVGQIMQVPPAFSAIKLGGERAYDLARAGHTVEIAARLARIESFALLSRPDAEHAEFHVVCGKGTYIRSLARDLARALGSAGHVAALRRTRVGPFGEADAISLDLLEEKAKHALPSERPAFLKEPAWGLDDIPDLRVDESMAATLSHGQPVFASPAFFSAEHGGGEEGNLYKAMFGRRLVALTTREGRLFSPVRVFNGS